MNQSIVEQIYGSKVFEGSGLRPQKGHLDSVSVDVFLWGHSTFSTNSSDLWFDIISGVKLE